jgi:hypothetical protein
MSEYRFRREHAPDRAAARWRAVDWTLVSWLVAAFLAGMVVTAHYLP